MVVSKFVEPLSLEKVVSASDNLDTSQLTTMEEVVLVTASSNEGSCTPISAEGSMVKKIDDNAHVPGSLNYDAGRENIVYVEILTPYKELENIVFLKFTMQQAARLIPQSGKGLQCRSST